MNFESCRLSTRGMEKLQKYCRSWKTTQALGKEKEGRAGWVHGEGKPPGKAKSSFGNEPIAFPSF